MVLASPAFTEFPDYLLISWGFIHREISKKVILDSNTEPTIADTTCGFIISLGANLDQISQPCKPWTTLAGK